MATNKLFSTDDLLAPSEGSVIQHEAARVISSKTNQPLFHSYRTTVLGTNTNNGNTYDLIFKLPDNIQLNPGHAGLICAGLAKKDQERLLRNVSSHSQKGIEALVPDAKGNRGAYLTFPTEKLLHKLVENLKLQEEKLQKSIDILGDLLEGNPSLENKLVKLKAKRLQLESYLSDQDKTLELQETYDVIDLLEIFPKALSIDEIVEAQSEKRNLAKTYALVDLENGSFGINVQESGERIYQNMFGENKEIFKEGLTSRYLRSLQKGDAAEVELSNTAKNGLTPVQREIYEANQRPTLILSQGNAYIKVRSILDHLQKRKAQGLPITPVSLVLSYKNLSSVLDLDTLKDYVKQGVIKDLHLCLSKENGKAPSSEYLSGTDKSIIVHKGIRPQVLLKSPEKLAAAYRLKQVSDKASQPYVQIIGGERFVEGRQGARKDATQQDIYKTSVLSAVCDTYGYAYDDAKQVAFSQSTSYRYQFAKAQKVNQNLALKRQGAVKTESKAYHRSVNKMLHNMAKLYQKIDRKTHTPPTAPKAKPKAATPVDLLTGDVVPTTLAAKDFSKSQTASIPRLFPEKDPKKVRELLAKSQAARRTPRALISSS